jgi:hypothetical protein
MTESDIRKMLAELAQQHEDLLAQRDAINVKIISKEQNMRNLQAALDETIYSAGHELGHGSVGLTEAIKTVLRRAEKPLTTGEVKTSLKIIGFDLERFANPAAAVANTLQRLGKSGDLEYLPNEQTYRYRVPSDHPLYRLRAKPRYK